MSIAFLFEVCFCSYVANAVRVEGRGREGGEGGCGLVVGLNNNVTFGYIEEHTTVGMWIY